LPYSEEYTIALIKVDNITIGLEDDVMDLIAYIIIQNFRDFLGCIVDVGFRMKQNFTKIGHEMLESWNKVEIHICFAKDEKPLPQEELDKMANTINPRTFACLGDQFLPENGNRYIDFRIISGGVQMFSSQSDAMIRKTIFVFVSFQKIC